MTRAVLVTGGSRGIGAEVVRQLAQRGRDVTATYNTSADAAEAVASEFPDSISTTSYQLGNQESAAGAVAATLARWGRLDALVLNAGRWSGGRLEAVSPTAWWDVVTANVAGAAQLTRAALPALRAGSDPSIVVISSVVGLIGNPGDTAYGSAKAALVGFARSLAKEVGRDGIRVNVLAPGLVETDMTAELDDRSRSQITSKLVLRRLGTAEEAAKAAVFLSEDATYCTGTILTVDGGWSI
ncbi:SDR family NAD(P)-dependent oxidoreductase [Mycobacterium sp.]|uniref:SDR family NAD(P)-dependent oxidoreductase n=1 Tax=Mycobacterium sp. TaxID=1785 RepID=UPI003BAF5CE2